MPSRAGDPHRVGVGCPLKYIYMQKQSTRNCHYQYLRVEPKCVVALPRARQLLAICLEGKGQLSLQFIRQLRHVLQGL